MIYLEYKIKSSGYKSAKDRRVFGRLQQTFEHLQSSIKLTKKVPAVSEVKYV